MRISKPATSVLGQTAAKLRHSSKAAGLSRDLLSLVGSAPFILRIELGIPYETATFPRESSCSIVFKRHVTGMRLYGPLFEKLDMYVLYPSQTDIGFPFLGARCHTGDISVFLLEFLRPYL